MFNPDAVEIGPQTVKIRHFRPTPAKFGQKHGRAWPEVCQIRSKLIGSNPNLTKIGPSLAKLGGSSMAQIWSSLVRCGPCLTEAVSNLFATGSHAVEIEQHLAGFGLNCVDTDPPVFCVCSARAASNLFGPQTRFGHARPLQGRRRHDLSVGVP